MRGRTRLWCSAYHQSFPSYTGPVPSVGGRSGQTGHPSWPPGVPAPPAPPQDPAPGSPPHHHTSLTCGWPSSSSGQPVDEHIN